MKITDKLRPNNLEDLVGHKELKNLLNNYIKQGFMQSLILYGNSGVGKSTVASVIAKQNFDKKVYKINAATSNLADLKEVLKETTYLFNSNGIILIVDEIHMYNKREIQTLLEYTEKGIVTLIGLTTENPYSTLPQGIVSRCITLYLNPLTKEELKLGIKNAIKKLNELDNKNITITPTAINKIVNLAPQGDMRQIINILETILLSKAYYSNEVIKILAEDIDNIKSIYSNSYCSNSTVTYNLLSALQKSIRGSDVDASIYYLGRLLHAGELQLLCRRLIIIAHEDISLANINAIFLTENAVRTALDVGLKEARIPLSNAVVLLAMSPKSNAPYLAIKHALTDIENGEIYDIPNHIKNRNKQKGKPYLYPHDYENNYVEQQYLPDELLDKKYYIPGNNSYEDALKKSIYNRTGKLK